MHTRIIGLGNTILSDDGVGIYTGRKLRRRLADAGLSDKVDVPIEARLSALWGLLVAKDALR
jgi:Ni,Fe-hydrogenase maturation factor